MENKPAVELHNVSVSFGGLRALNDISFTIDQGGTFGIIGPNGAGKTTLFNCITGFFLPSPGSEILLNGQSIIGKTVNEIAGMGAARTFQNISLNKGLTARENILTGMHLVLDYNPISAFFPSRHIRNAETQAMKRIDVIAAQLGLSQPVLDSKVSTLSLGVQKKIEVVRALVRSPRLLFLDEPAGGLNDMESRELQQGLMQIAKSNPELTIVLIDHDMNFVMPLCQKIAVLNFGQLVAVGDSRSIARDPAVISCYLGEDDAA